MSPITISLSRAWPRENLDSGTTQMGSWILVYITTPMISVHDLRSLEKSSSTVHELGTTTAMSRCLVPFFLISWVLEQRLSESCNKIINILQAPYLVWLPHRSQEKSNCTKEIWIHRFWGQDPASDDVIIWGLKKHYPILCLWIE